MNYRKEYFALLTLSILTVIFFFPVIFLGKTFYLRDLTYIFHPWKSLCAQAVQRGEIPLWDQYAFCGMPLLANWQSAVFYPFSLIFYIFDFSTALKFYHFSQVILAGYFAYLFGRKELGSNNSALVMMVIFSFSGFFITKLEFLSYAGVIAWTFAPMLLRKNPLLLSVALCFSFLAGHQVFIFQVFILLMFVLYDLSNTENDVTLIKNYGLKLALAAVIAMCLSACQLLPTIELISGSFRSREGIDYAIAMLHSISFSGLPGFISPLIHNIKSDLVAGEFMQWDTTFYIGFVGICIAAAGLLGKRSGKLRILSAVLIVTGIVLAMGDKTPVYPWLYKHFFIFHTMRYPVQYAYISVVGLTTLAGIGIKHFKYGLLIIALSAVELLAVSTGFQPLADNNYFYQKSAIIDVLQNDPQNTRFILSPGTEKDRFIHATSIENGWQKARGSLYNLTCLPYHLSNAYGFGEPLTSYSIETTINAIYSITGARKAAPAFKELGIGYLICRDKLIDSTGYTLTTDKPLYIYKIDSNPGPYEFMPIATGQDTFKYSGDFNRRHFEFSNTSDHKFIWKECIYPGWKLFINSKPTPYRTYKGMFPEFDVSAGLNDAYYFYEPLSFRLGLSLTLITIIVGVIFLSRKLRGKTDE